jgi:site-specific recombinase XerD
MKHPRRSSRRQLSGSTVHNVNTARQTSKLSQQPIDITALHHQYVAYLRDEKGLARNSILVYSLHTRNYLTTQGGKRSQVLQSAFDVNTMRAHILEYSKGRSGEYIRLMTVSLRSLCHFFFLHGYTLSDSFEAIPRFRKHRLASVPNYLTPEQVDSVLEATDRSTRTGSRDYAILLLLARLGLRASEIVSLTLDDIRWRSSEITIHGKGQVVERVPLLSDIGEAIAAYLRDFRQDVLTRRLFLSGWVAHVGLSGPATIGHIVRRAFARIKFKPSSRGASHLFRHGLATNMIRQGASMAQIAQVMRHRSELTTATYAKVAFEDLRAVARPWPIVGGQS